MSRVAVRQVRLQNRNVTKGKLMKARSFISAGALAIALAALAPAAMAEAPDRHGWSGESQRGQNDGRRGSWSGQSQDHGNRNGGQDRGNWQYRSSSRDATAAPAPEQAQPEQPRPSNRATRNWSGAREAAVPDRPRTQPAERTARGYENRGNRWSGAAGDQDQVRDRQRDNTRGNARDNRDTWRGNRYDNARNDGRDGWRGDRNRDYRRDDRGDHRAWNRNDWRRDHRYNWQNYRNSHRSIYRIGRYHSPYHNHAYRRLGIGFFLGSVFYGNQYWISDPWSYRLPAVYGPYRWVRYYDDVLLVDTYTGEVVDVIYDFFW